MQTCGSGAQNDFNAFFKIKLNLAILTIQQPLLKIPDS